ARAAPMPGIRRKSSGVARTRPCRPPTAASTALASSSALARGIPCPSTIASSSLSPSDPAPTRSSFSRGRSCGATVFIVHHPAAILGVVRRWNTQIFLLFALLLPGCSEPPQKEIDQAQAAIDSARTAGADRYAADEFTAATTALQKAHESVDQRDYRSAL